MAGGEQGYGERADVGILLSGEEGAEGADEVDPHVPNGPI